MSTTTILSVSAGVHTPATSLLAGLDSLVLWMKGKVETSGAIVMRSVVSSCQLTGTFDGYCLRTSDYTLYIGDAALVQATKTSLGGVTAKWDASKPFVDRISDAMSSQPLLLIGLAGAGAAGGYLL